MKQFMETFSLQELEDFLSDKLEEDSDFDSILSTFRNGYTKTFAWSLDINKDPFLSILISEPEE
jgi:hypothetical protein